ncbi:MAG: hypothetical protein JWP58_4101 [Hymenobacter sp.]|nr:hypothetical protein [Hymenobacter sp.]
MGPQRTGAGPRPAPHQCAIARMKNNALAACLSFFALVGCSSLKPESFSSTTSTTDPITFFGGHTHSTGVIESPSGQPAERITTQTAGVLANGTLRMEQDLHSEDSKPTHRTFTFNIIDAHHVDATGSDIAGTAHGKLYGNYFTWSFRLKVADKGPIHRVSMTQHMYLMPDGKTLIIRSIIRKFGITVKEITEQFHKDD